MIRRQNYKEQQRFQWHQKATITKKQDPLKHISK